MSAIPTEEAVYQCANALYTTLAERSLTLAAAGAPS